MSLPSQYNFDFAAASAQDPWDAAANGWTNVNNSFEIAGGGLRPNGFVQATAKLNTVATAAIIKSKMTFATNGSAFSDPAGPAIIDNSTGALYVFWINGVGASSGQIQERTTGSGAATVLGAGFAIASAGTSDVFELWYEVATGTLSAVLNDVVLATRTDTTLQASTLCCGLFANPANNNGRRVGQFGADYAAGVTIASSPSNLRISEQRTFRIQVPTTAPTTLNTVAYVNADTNDDIVPDSVTLVSGSDYDVVITVPDVYADLKYSATGYPVIISTTDGDATSANIPYLPVTGNAFVDAESVPGDITILSGDLVVGAQLEYQSLGTIEIEEVEYQVIEIDGDLFIIFSGADPEDVAFNVRAWDPSDETWGPYALQTLNPSEDPGVDNLNSRALGWRVPGSISLRQSLRVLK